MDEPVDLAPSAEPRSERALETGWHYAPGRQSARWLRSFPEHPESPAVEIELPHSWNATDGFRFGVGYRRGHGCYRTLLTLEPAQPGRVRRVEVGPFFGRGELYVDGVRLTRAEGQYLGFGVDLPASLAAGEHVLALRLDNRHRRRALPARRNPDFLLYGGLAGGVRLVDLPETRLGALRIVPQLDGESAVRGESARLWVAAQLDGPSGRAELGAGQRLGVRVWDGGGELHAQARSQEGHGEVVAELPSVRRWSVSDPWLYTVEVSLLDGDGREIDRLTRRVGFRTARFGSEGFFLNGERLLVAGCNRHESLPGFGSALPQELERRDAELLREIGANMVRLSHYPQRAEFLDACDELGLLVYAELASWKSVGEAAFLGAAREQFARLIERDRHRPSVVIWGMGNESRSRRSYEELGKMARELDPTRPISYAENHLYRARREDTLGLVDVWGVNYELEVLDEAASAGRSGSVLVTECMNPCLRKEDSDTATRQITAMQEEWPLITQKPFVAGYLVWCFADYATQYRRRYRRIAGLFDAWRRPRAGAYLFRARHSEELFVHLEAAWQEDLESPESKRRVRVFSNAERVELFAGTERVASFEGAGPLIEDEVVFRPVALEARAWRGSGVTTSRIEPWNAPASLALSSETMGGETDRWRILDVGVQDAAGRLVRSWNGEVRLEVEGPGQLRSYDGAGTVEVVDGEGTGYLRIDRGVGLAPPAELEVVARGASLLPGRLVIPSLVEAKP